MCNGNGCTSQSIRNTLSETKVDASRYVSVRAREAARALGISERTLWELSSPRGPIPCVRVGNGKRQIVLYPLVELQAWLTKQAGTASGGDSNAN